MPPRSTLITGGVRSGKSAYAEALLREQVQVTYIAPGPKPDPVADPEWAERVDQHQARRPPHWTTIETVDVTPAVSAAPGAVLLDCLGTWVSALMDQFDGWERPAEQWRPEFDHHLDSLAAAWSSARGPLIAVTNEVGMGVVPEHRSGRLFRDLLGVVNQRIASVSDDVLLVIAGRVLRL